jgi:hypothetical protein
MHGAKAVNVLVCNLYFQTMAALMRKGGSTVGALMYWLTAVSRMSGAQ